jgi:hypothetical protein
MFKKTNHDHWGYYQVGYNKVYSKLEAIELSGKLRQPLNWRFNPEVFDHYDWTSEPPGTLEQWYKARALQLRETYNYLVLFYSAGADSHNMLMSFVKNNIFVDEIVQLHSMEIYNNDRTVEANVEQFSTSIPNTKRLIENNPVYKNTVHRLIDLSCWSRTVMTQPQNKWDYLYDYCGNINSVWGASVGSVREIEPAYKALADQGKDVCFVWGIDKPELTWSPEGYRLGFCDGGLLIFRLPRDQRNPQSWHHDEAFYWTPDMPQLVAKQAHICKRFVKGITPEMPDGFFIRPGVFKHAEDLSTIFSAPRISAKVNGNDYYLTDHGLHKLIYPYWDHRTIVRSKNRNAMFPDIDGFLWNSQAPDFGQHHYQRSMPWLRSTVIKNTPELWWEHKGVPGRSIYRGGIKPLRIFYNIGT